MSPPSTPSQQAFYFDQLEVPCVRPLVPQAGATVGDVEPNAPRLAEAGVSPENQLARILKRSFMMTGSDRQEVTLRLSIRHLTAHDLGNYHEGVLC